MPKLLFLTLVLALLKAVPVTAGTVKYKVDINKSAGTVTLLDEGRPVLLYRYENVPYKPYVQALSTPGGSNVLLDSPDDHKHHHALMFALTVNGTDFWGEAGDAVGTQVSETPEAIDPGRKGTKKGTGFAHDIVWKNSRGEALLHESREIRVYDRSRPPILLTWQTSLQLPESLDTAGLSGHHYFGLGMRFVREMDDNCNFVHPEGSTGSVYRGDERLTPGSWCACQSTVGGKPVTVALFDHPMNPRYPATFFTMARPFAYLSATLNLHAQPRRLGKGKTVELRYGVALWDGHIDPEGIRKTHDEWVALESPLRGHVNVALARYGTTASASSEYTPDYAAAKAIDGRYGVRETDKWNSSVHITPHYLRLDLGKPRTIEAIVIRHEGALPLPDAFRYNTSDFHIQQSKKPWGPWIDIIEPVRGNTDNVTLHRFDPVDVRYLRLLIETGEQGGGNAYGRITEMEVYAPKASL